MTIRYELNPPRVDGYTQKQIDTISQRILSISSVCDGIHLTDSVLGIPRISPFEIAKLVRKYDKNIKITASLRVRDRNLNEIEQIVKESNEFLDGILVLMGDKSQNNSDESGLFPSQVVKHLLTHDINGNCELFLSIPNNPNFEKIQKKINARPRGFFTQVIHSKSQIERIFDYLSPKGLSVIPCLIFPSDKNSRSAEFLNLDSSNYQDDIVDFIKDIEKLTGDVLISSPNDFKGAHASLSKIAS